MALQQLNANRFEEIIYDECEPCLVLFSRKDCHVCQEVAPMLAELKPQYEGKFGFYYVDVEEDRELFKRFSLKGVPQILFFNEGEYQGKLAGQVEEDEVEEKIAEVLGE
ncbi:thioredoxin family protein [Desulforamulus ferrireducens]|uniref:Thiol reductase thioredoxin n=1 Tax=Desulforamulus ferrireducens TaxID=1833852 RepID=A0A1S6ITJ5_9FIRM|nr:thioredoxin family protein [Desulforamulus ferrireducens]AQS58087.1 thiol reductase thioredoxin [Desulforamulus ferrireducens]